MTQDFAIHRNREEDTIRVRKVREILGVPINVEYGLPAHIVVSVPGPIVDDAKRKALIDLDWRVVYDMYRDVSVVYVPHSRCLDHSVIRRYIRMAIWCVVIWSLIHVGMAFNEKSKIMD